MILNGIEKLRDGNSGSLLIKADNNMLLKAKTISVTQPSKYVEGDIKGDVAVTGKEEVPLSRVVTVPIAWSLQFAECIVQYLLYFNSVVLYVLFCILAHFKSSFAFSTSFQWLLK